MKQIIPIVILMVGMLYVACDGSEPADVVPPQVVDKQIPESEIKPLVVTEEVKHDTDDPAIWIDSTNPENSLIIGTDKDQEGALYVFDLRGNIIEDKVVRGLERPNNVDIEYGFDLNGESVDIAVVSERYTHKLRVFRLPDMQPIDNGGIPIFEGETGNEHRDLMGIALYKSPLSQNIYAIAGRKDGPKDGTYLWQYLLQTDSTGHVSATVVRKFGQYSGKKEIEAIAVDDKLGYVYYSDETAGVRKYYAEPDRGNEELALFATENFSQDQEGISIYEASDNTGYILVSDQQNQRFQIFKREGTATKPHQHELVKIIKVDALESDGSDVTHVSLNSSFRKGLFVAMSGDKTFHYYSWEDIAGPHLRMAQ